MASALKVVRFAGQGRAPSDLIPWTKSPWELLNVVFSYWILFPGSELERGEGGRSQPLGCHTLPCCWPGKTVGTAGS